LLCIKSVPVSENKEASNKESGDKNPAVAFVRTALIGGRHWPVDAQLPFPSEPVVGF